MEKINDARLQYAVSGIQAGIRWQTQRYKRVQVPIFSLC